MTPERRIQIDKQVFWAKLKLSVGDFNDWCLNNLRPEEYMTGHDGILSDWCERCEYLDRVGDCTDETCRVKNENSNSIE